MKIRPSPLTVEIEIRNGRLVQRLRMEDAAAAQVAFLIGDGPVFGLGEGGPQFDRRGSHDPMRSGQGGYRLRTHGGRVPVPGLIGTAGWALFVHQPRGTFDLTSKEEGRFLPETDDAGLPLDIFIVWHEKPVQAMAEYAGLTGYAELLQRRMDGDTDDVERVGSNTQSAARARFQASAAAPPADRSPGCGRGNAPVDRLRRPPYPD